MTHQAAVAHLLSLGPEMKAGKFGLEGITRLAAALGDPQFATPAVLIAGTNGKGSTAAMLENCLRSSGYRTGLYTSPHLARINERIHNLWETLMPLFEANELYQGRYSQLMKECGVLPQN